MIDVVVAYDRTAAALLEQHVYSDEPELAFAKRFERERAYRRRLDVEVVLLSALSLDDLKVSHARYFDPTAIRADQLKNVSEEMARRAAS